MSRTAHNEAMSWELEPAIKARVELLAQQRKKKPGEIANAALRRFLDEHQRISAAISVGLEAADRGKVIADDRVDSWLASWGHDDELEPPMCD